MNFKFSILTFCLFLSGFSFAQKGGKNKLWYDKPAKQWVEALPVGNGRLASMVLEILIRKNFS
jgi:alpha-L-fucosidase 2